MHTPWLGSKSVEDRESERMSMDVYVYVCAPYSLISLSLSAFAIFVKLFPLMYTIFLYFIRFDYMDRTFSFFSLILTISVLSVCCSFTLCVYAPRVLLSVLCAREQNNWNKFSTRKKRAK